MPFARCTSRILPLVALGVLACQQPSPPPPVPAPPPSAASPAPSPSPSATPTAPSLPERAGVIERKGAPRTLVGPELGVGDAAPTFDLVDPQLGRVRAADLAGKAVLLSVVPSLDTPVCEAQTGHLAGEQGNFPDGLMLLTVSRDLPFAQRRFLADNQIDTKMASDFDTATFGKAWGVYIKESGLLARSLWVIGKDGKIAYRQIVREQSSEPDYEPALIAARAAAEAP